MAGALVERKLIPFQNRAIVFNSKTAVEKGNELRDIATLFSLFFIFFEISFVAVSFALQFSPLNELPTGITTALWDLRLFISAGAACLIFSTISNRLQP